MEKFFTTKEAAGYLGISDGAVRQLIGRGTLPAKMMGDVWLISESALRDRATSVSAQKRSRARRRPPMTAKPSEAKLEGLEDA